MQQKLDVIGLSVVNMFMIIIKDQIKYIFYRITFFLFQFTKFGNILYLQLVYMQALTFYTYVNMFLIKCIYLQFS